MHLRPTLYPGMSLSTYKTNRTLRVATVCQFVEQCEHTSVFGRTNDGHVFLLLLLDGCVVVSVGIHSVMFFTRFPPGSQLQTCDFRVFMHILQMRRQFELKVPMPFHIPLLETLPRTAFETTMHNRKSNPACHIFETLFSLRIRNVWRQ